MMKKICKVLLLVNIVLLISSCATYEEKFGGDTDGFNKSKESPAVKLPKGSLAPSDKFLIP